MPASASCGAKQKVKPKAESEDGCLRVLVPSWLKNVNHSAKPVWNTARTNCFFEGQPNEGTSLEVT
jgi:hypothetical protein